MLAIVFEWQRDQLAAIAWVGGYHLLQEAEKKSRWFPSRNLC